TGRAPELKPGDLIKIFRGKFKHWAVYVGIGHVVHIMVQEHVWLAHLVACAMGMDYFRVNNERDGVRFLQAAEVIVGNTEQLVGLKVEYSATGANCQHLSRSKMLHCCCINICCLTMHRKSCNKYLFFKKLF
uniref:LRAT domain-containing protein n=1 Tax=Callorhinchus milii TaxID=7868 RepID=A0A4W3H5I2_CALMI